MVIKSRLKKQFIFVILRFHEMICFLSMYLSISLIFQCYFAFMLQGFILFFIESFNKRTNLIYECMSQNISFD